MVLAAAQRAAFAEAAGTLKARTLHMELIYQLSPRTNVPAGQVRAGHCRSA